MSMSCHPFLSACGLLLVFISVFLQLVALLTSWWATFSALTDLGKPKEDGHYGLWSLCSTKGPHWMEDCDPLDTFFQVPSYLHISGILGILNIVIILIFLPFGCISVVQIVRNMPHLCMKPKTLSIAKISVAFISVILAILVATFASVGEMRQTEYSIQKGWSFWLQISVIVIDIVLTILCVMEHFKQRYVQHHFDPEGTRAETYGNPTFDADSPELSRHHLSSNGTIAYTESSGHPYTAGRSVNGSSNKMNKQSGKDGASTTSENDKSHNVLTYENECYREHSPSFGRAGKGNGH